MKAVNDIWRQLVGRRLLPVAIVLAAALAAVPLALGKDAVKPPAPKLQPVDATAAAATKTIVSVAAPSTKRRTVLGSKVNPFLGQKLPKPKKQKKEGQGTTSEAGDAPTGGSAPDVPTSTGGGTTPTPSTGYSPIAPGPVPAPTAPKRQYDRYDLTVRFGDASSDSLERGTVSLLEALPSAEDALIAYVDVADNGKSAVFLLDEGVVANGDGECRGAASDCETVRLRAGETEFFELVDETGTVTASYQLDLIKIHRAGGASASAAKPTRSVSGHAAARGQVASVMSAALAGGL